MAAVSGSQLRGEHLLHRPRHGFAQGQHARAADVWGQQLLGSHVTEDGCDRDKTRLPAIRVEVMFDVFAVIVWLLMLSHEVGWQRAAAPLAAVRLRVHPIQGALEVGRRHVVAVPKAAGRQTTAVGEVVAKTHTTARDHLQQLAVGWRADVALQVH
jgi:hypothetical protein